MFDEEPGPKALNDVLERAIFESKALETHQEKEAHTMVRLQRRWVVASFALLAVAMAPCMSRATTITFTQSPVDTNIQIGKFIQDGPNQVIGQEMNAGVGTDLLTVLADVGIQPQTDGAGQAFIEPSTADNVNSIIIRPIDPPLEGFSVLEFNPERATHDTGTMTLYAWDTVVADPLANLGSALATGTFAFGPGNNRTAAVATGGFIKTLLVTFDPAAGDLKQFRLGYTLAPVPEPSSIALVASALIPLGVAGIRRLRRKADA